MSFDKIGSDETLQSQNDYSTNDLDAEPQDFHSAGLDQQNVFTKQTTVEGKPQKDRAERLEAKPLMGSEKPQPHPEVQIKIKPLAVETKSIRDELLATAQRRKEVSGASASSEVGGISASRDEDKPKMTPSKPIKVVSPLRTKVVEQDDGHLADDEEEHSVGSMKYIPGTNIAEFPLQRPVLFSQKEQPALQTGAKSNKIPMSYPKVASEVAGARGSSLEMSAQVMHTAGSARFDPSTLTKGSEVVTEFPKHRVSGFQSKDSQRRDAMRNRDYHDNLLGYGIRTVGARKVQPQPPAPVGEGQRLVEPKPPSQGKKEITETKVLTDDELRRKRLERLKNLK
ncbi:hypothetical protein [Parashewanella tropica]|uniref:hypothetical protein n=1 Tax=Parashewanella tropica TaxID=2547970 RepID=UPI00105A0876|nr:hypothetical protein [Parashewanella tropica]